MSNKLEDIQYMHIPPPDRNECLANADDCDQICIDTIGSYSCSCNAGYTLASDGRQCLGINHYYF